MGAVLVVGGGIAGMQSALDLAQAGFLVHLVEEKGGIGGWMSRLDKTFPTNDCAMCILAPKLVEVGRHPNVRLRTSARLLSLEGEAGDFTATIEDRPRYIDPARCTGCSLCAQWCPVEAVSAYDKGVGDRPAVSALFPQTVPLVYSIDRDACIGCGLCAEVCAVHAVDYAQQPKQEAVRVGAVVLAAGFDDLPGDIRPEYGWGRFPNVVTSPQFERILSASGPYAGEVLRPSDGKRPARIAWLQCVGSRDEHRGRGYCSSVCCTYATKEAVIAKEHLGRGSVDCYIFFMDMRTFGKGFEEYYDRAREEYGVRYTRCRIGEVVEDPRTHDLEVVFEDEEGRAGRERFDLVVLSTGLDPPPTVKELAQAAGVALTEQGFVRTGVFDPVATSRPGVFACGALSGPKDIPDTVSEASAAAGRAASVVAPSRGTEVSAPAMPEETDVSAAEARVGVFVCHCGINIGGVVDVPAVVEHARGLPGVAWVEHNLYTCSQDTQDRIVERVRATGINRVVVASCTPRTHEPLFQGTIQKAGLNPYLFELASLREQGSWVHKDDPGGATEKAMRMVEMAVDKVRRAMPVVKQLSPVEPVGLVIGGGPAGMAAALGLADQGIRAVLVERGDRLGGGMLRLPHVLEAEDPRAALAGMVERVRGSPLVETLLSSELVDLDGVVGGYEATVRTPKGDRTVHVGAIVVATGARELLPRGEHLYGEDPRVMTSLEAGEALEAGTFPAEGPVAFIQCVGSRIPERPYCSRVCCSTAVKNALRVKERDPKREVVVLYRDIRTYGMREGAYRRARDLGVLFARFDLDRPPVISRDGAGLSLEYVDLVARRRVRRRVGAVVLASASVPSEGAEALGQMLKVPLDGHGFFLEAHMKIRPLDFATDGVFLAGACHSQKFLGEAIAQGLGAASRAATVLANPTVLTEGLPARVDAARCTGCGVCEANCAYEAIEVDLETGVASVSEVLCKGCGTCAAVCPSGAVTLPRYEKEQIVAMIEDAVLPERGEG